MKKIVVLLIAFSAVGCHFRFSKLDYYQPVDVDLKSTFRTMAEHDSLMADKEWPYILKVGGSNSSLIYYGSWHTNNPDNPQIAEIEKIWKEFKPTVGVTENRLGFIIGSEESDIKSYGEFAMAYIMAGRDKIPVYTLEPSWESEAAEMKAKFPTPEVTLFYTMRVFLSERKSGMSTSEIEDLATHLLKKRGSRAGLEGSLNSLDEMDALWQKHYSDLGDWRIIKGSAIHPSANPTRLSRMANFANEVRDLHAAKVIVDLMNQGNRVFAIAGGSHVVKQEPVIRASLE